MWVWGPTWLRWVCGLMCMGFPSRMNSPPRTPACAIYRRREQRESLAAVRGASQSECHVRDQM
jgi:hypothetical protein